MKPLVIYHADCTDGFCCAWLFHKYRAEDAEFVAANYANAVPENFGIAVPDAKDRDVYIFDFSYDAEIMRRIADEAKSLTIIDHHKTAKEAIESVKDKAKVIFDEGHSAAWLVWDWLGCPAMEAVFVEYVEDRDIWKWEKPHSREFSAALRSYPMYFATWSNVASMGIDYLVDQGKAILRYQKQLVDKHVRRAGTHTFSGGGKVYTVPCVNATVLQSEIGQELCKGHPFAATWMEVDGKIIYSLRSDKDGIDVGEFAKTQGGGGHKHAAGFTEYV